MFLLFPVADDIKLHISPIQTSAGRGLGTASVENGALLNHLGLIALAGIVSTVAVSKVGMVPIVHQRIPPSKVTWKTNSKKRWLKDAKRPTTGMIPTSKWNLIKWLSPH